MLRNMSLSLLQYAMHCGCMLPLKWVLVPLYTVSLCTADTATCMDTASTLYCMVCTVGAATYVRGFCCRFILYTLYAMQCAWVLPHVWDYFNIHYARNFTQHVFKKLLCFECAAYVHAAWPCLNVAEFGGNWVQ